MAPILPEALHGYSHFVCAAGAFLTCSVVLVPGELLKQRLQVHRNEIGPCGGTGTYCLVSCILYQGDGILCYVDIYRWIHRPFSVGVVALC